MKYALFALALVLLVLLAVLAGLALSRSSEGPRLSRPNDDPCPEVKVDLDFTSMNATVRAAQLYRLVSNPREFVDKVLRVSGVFIMRIDPSDGKRHFGCLLDDIGGCSCCSSGEILEFEPLSGSEWPKGFPRPESGIVVTGRLKMVQVSPCANMSFAVPRLVDACLK